MALSVCVHFEVPKRIFVPVIAFTSDHPLSIFQNQGEPIQTYLSDVLMGRWKLNILYNCLFFLHFHLQQHESSNGLLLCRVHFAGQTEG